MNSAITAILGLLVSSCLARKGGIPDHVTTTSTTLCFRLRIVLRVPCVWQLNRITTCDQLDSLNSAVCLRDRVLSIPHFPRS